MAQHFRFVIKRDKRRPFVVHFFDATLADLTEMREWITQNVHYDDVLFDAFNEYAEFSERADAVRFRFTFERS